MLAVDSFRGRESILANPGRRRRRLQQHMAVGRERRLWAAFFLVENRPPWPIPAIDASAKAPVPREGGVPAVATPNGSNRDVAYSTLTVRAPGRTTLPKWRNGTERAHGRESRLKGAPRPRRCEMAADSLCWCRSGLRTYLARLLRTSLGRVSEPLTPIPTRTRHDAPAGSRR